MSSSCEKHKLALRRELLRHRMRTELRVQNQLKIRRGAGGGPGDKYVRIPFAAMTHGREKWTRLYWSQDRREHQIETSDLLDAPKFPDKPFSELLKLAFKDAVISTVDHPAILNLKGKAK